MVSTRHIPGKGYTEEALSLSRMISEDELDKIESQKFDDAIHKIVGYFLFGSILFAVGFGIGSCAREADFTSTLCRSMPTTEEYFQCRSAIDINREYKLVKR